MLTKISNLDRGTFFGLNARAYLLLEHGQDLCDAIEFNASGKEMKLIKLKRELKLK